MFSRFRNFVSRHRRKFVVAGVVLGGAVLLSRYVRKALRDWQEKETKEFLDRTRKQQHYDSVERTCNQTAITLIPTMKEAIADLYDTDNIVIQLKEGKSNKLELWEKLKYLSFSKVTHFVYLSSMLMVTLRLQLNLLGGYIFKDSMDDNVQNAEHLGLLHERYLAFTKHLLTEGAKEMRHLIQEKVAIVLKARSLKEKLVIQDIEQIFWAVNSSLSSDPRNPCKHLAKYIIPSAIENLPTEQQALFNKITTETRDLLESEEIIALTSSSISRGFTNFVDKLAEYFIVRDRRAENVASTSSDTFFSSNMSEVESEVISHVSIPLAKVIPIVNGLIGGRGGKTDVPYTWMQQLILMDDLKVLGANVYEGFSV